jgi:FixJ family two-component response regulator
MRHKEGGATRPRAGERATVATTTATIFVVDDDADVREALTRLLRSAGWGVSAFADGDAFLAAVDEMHAGCLLLDVTMPGLTGPQVHDALRARGLSLPVIFLTGNGSVSDGVRAMKHGALDFLEKPVDADALLPAIEQAVQRHRAERARRDQLGDIARRLARLSGREREVLEHVVAGRLNKQIAGDLGIAEKTVKVHRGRVMAKMHVRTLADLVHLWDRWRAADPRPGGEGA